MHVEPTLCSGHCNPWSQPSPSPSILSLTGQLALCWTHNCSLCTCCKRWATAFRAVRHAPVQLPSTKTPVPARTHKIVAGLLCNARRRCDTGLDLSAHNSQNCSIAGTRHPEPAVGSRPSICATFCTCAPDRELSGPCPAAFGAFGCAWSGDLP